VEGPVKLFARAVQRSVSKGLLIAPVRAPNVLWTPSVEAKFRAPTSARGRPVELKYPDMIVGTYSALRTLREVLRKEKPTLWLGTDIHHIVENQHLQFVGRRGVIGERSYRHDEPCVLLPQDHHRLLMSSLIGGSVTLHREQRLEDDNYGIDCIAEYNAYRKDNPVVVNTSQAARDAKAQHRAEWVSRQEGGTRREIGELLLDIYEFAYHQSAEMPLDVIAADTIEALSE
jgi:hypothetical protein